MEYFPIYDEDGNEYDDLMFKKCTKCLEVKLKTEFYHHPGGKNNLTASCKTCQRKYVMSYKKTHRDEHNEHCLKYYYRHREARLMYARRKRRQKLIRTKPHD